MESISSDLKSLWSDLLKENPRLRIRNAANKLACSEVELLATKVGEGVIRLKPDFPAILTRIEELGYVMALTRNDDVVHERKGVYKNFEYGKHASLFVNPDIDLRIFLSVWDSAFAVEEGDRKSVQFFGKDGSAVHKVYLTEQSNEEAFNALINEFESEDQSNHQLVAENSAPKMEMPDEAVDIEGFRGDWKSLKDTHDFFMLLGKHRISRTQALRLAPEGNYAVKVDNSALRTLFNKVVERKVPIMVFVGNKGMIQIHTGEIKNLLDRDVWFNVIDPEFNLHVRETAIKQSWVVRKPTVDGMVTALELYDDNGEQIASIFGKRKPGIPELESWRAVVEEVEAGLKD